MWYILTPCSFHFNSSTFCWSFDFWMNENTWKNCHHSLEKTQAPLPVFLSTTWILSQTIKYFHVFNWWKHVVGSCNGRRNWHNSNTFPSILNDRPYNWKRFWKKLALIHEMSGLAWSRWLIIEIRVPLIKKIFQLEYFLYWVRAACWDIWNQNKNIVTWWWMPRIHLDPLYVLATFVYSMDMP